MNKRTTKTTRELKVYTRCNNPIYARRSLLPEICLKGSWLRKWGFDCGNEIKVIKTKFGISIVNCKVEIPFVIL